MVDEKINIMIIYNTKKQITMFKVLPYSELFKVVEKYKALASITNEKVIYFKIEPTESPNLEYLKEHTLVNVDFLKSFKHFNFEI